MVSAAWKSLCTFVGVLADPAGGFCGATTIQGNGTRRSIRTCSAAVRLDRALYIPCHRKGLRRVHPRPLDAWIGCRARGDDRLRGGRKRATSITARRVSRTEVSPKGVRSSVVGLAWWVEMPALWVLSNRAGQERHRYEGGRRRHGELAAFSWGPPSLKGGSDLVTFLVSPLRRSITGPPNTYPGGTLHNGRTVSRATCP